MRIRDAKLAKTAATVVVTGMLVAAPLIGASAAERNRAPSISLSFERLSNFTPAAADPRLAAMFGNRALNEFRFTPAAAKSRPSQVRVAVRSSTVVARPTRPIEVATAIPATTLAPTNYDLGVAVGWKKLAVSGDVSRVRSLDPAIGARDTVVVGVSYNLKKVTGRVAVSGERNNSRLAQLERPDSVALDVGASFNVSRNIAVNGGVRYSIERDEVPALADERRDSKGVYVGTAFKF